MLTFHQVVARLDLLAVVLVYVMSTGYLFYYFVSFVSILYIVVYVTTAFGSQYSGRAVILVCGALVAATDTTFVINEESLLEEIFSVLGAYAISVNRQRYPRSDFGLTTTG